MVEISKRGAVNAILAEWNPIGVPNAIAKFEYSSYVDEILAKASNKTHLVTYLENLVSEIMGLSYDATNASHKSDLEAVAESIIEVENGKDNS